jgi:hypothetical protein
MRILAAVVLIVIVGLSAWRIAELSAQYPDPQLYEVGVGEEVRGGDIGITAVGARLLDSPQIDELIPGFESGMLDDSGRPLDKESVRMLVVELEVTNYSSEEQQVALYDFVAASRAWNNGTDMLSFMELNEGNGPALTMGANQSRTVLMPFPLIESQFQSAADWGAAADRPFDLVLTRYPIKTVIHLLNDNT